MSGKRCSCREKIVIGLLLTSNLMIGTILSLPAPFLPILNEKHNLNSETTGWMISVFPFVRLATVPILAKYVTKIGLYEVTCFGQLFAGGTTIIFGLMEYLPIPSDPNRTDWAYIILCFTTRAFQSIGSCAITIASMTVISVTASGNTTTVMALFETMFCVGAMVGPVLGSGLYKIGGFVAVFSGVGGLLVILSFFSFGYLPRVRKSQSDEGASVVSLLRLPRFTGSLFILIYGAAMWSSLDPILESEFRSKFQLTPEISALCFLSLAGAYGISCPLVGKILDQKYCKDGLVLMVLGLFVSMVAFIFAGPCAFFDANFPRPLWLLLCCVGLIGLACGLVHISSLNLVYKIDDEEVKNNAVTNGIIAGLWSGSFAVGDFLGPIMSGSITNDSSFSWATTFMAGLGFVFLILTIILLVVTKAMNKTTVSEKS